MAGMWAPRYARAISAMRWRNLAVLHSFVAAEVTITDRHTESAKFLKLIALEGAGPHLPGRLEVDRRIHDPPLASEVDVGSVGRPVAASTPGEWDELASGDEK